MKGKKREKLLIVLIALLAFTSSCEQVAKFTEVATGGSAVSEIVFEGVSSITGVTDSTATIHWNAHAEASFYVIFDVTSDSPVVVKTLESGTSYTVTGLSASTSYKFRVRATDQNAFPETNTNDVLFMTNAAPEAPSSLTLQSPAYTPNLINTVTIAVGGVKSGDTVKIFTDSSCSSEVGSVVATASTVNIASSVLDVGSYDFYANSTGENSSACSSAKVSYERVSCPNDYIAVPGNAAVGAPNLFCVMKYEAKDVGGVATSQASGSPWVSISQESAWDECDDLNSEALRADIDSDTGSDGTYAMISNPEWMAIARNIETNTQNEDDNWSGGSVGSGHLARGWVTGNSAVAPSTGASCLYNSAANTCAATGDHEDKRVLTLSNDEEIWDLSGNVWEWVDWTLGSPLSTNMSSGAAGDKPFDNDDGAPVSAWREFTQIDTFSLLAPDTSIEPTDNALDATNGIGRYYGGTSGGAALRGGDWYNGTNAGAFALALNNSSSSTTTFLGFRCVFRLP